MKLTMKLLIVAILAFTVSACSTGSKLEKLGYDSGAIENLKDKEYAKTLVREGVTFDQYSKIIEHKSYDEKNMIHYVQILNDAYSIDELDQLIVGTNLLIKSNDDKQNNPEDVKAKLEQLLKPELELKSIEYNASLSANSDEVLKNSIVAKSQFDGDIKNNIVVETDFNVAKIGTYNVKITAEDSKGYKSELTEEIKVVDNTKPVIEIPSNVTIYQDDSIDLSKIIKATDNLDGDLSKSLVIDKGGFSTSKPGIYTVNCNVTDSAGNEAKESLTIEVLPAVKLKESFAVNKYTLVANSYSFNRTDSEPADGFYQYYNAEDNQIFLILNLQIKNEYDIKRTPFDIFGNDSEKIKAEIIYDGKYTYDSTPHGLDNNWYDTFMSLDPLANKTRNLTFEVPIEAKDSSKSLVLKFSSYDSTADEVYLRIR